METKEPTGSLVSGFDHDGRSEDRLIPDGMGTPHLVLTMGPRLIRNIAAHQKAEGLLEAATRMDLFMAVTSGILEIVIYLF